MIPTPKGLALVEKFHAACLEHAQATLNANYKMANKNYYKLKSTFGEITKIGEINLLLPSLHSIHPGIRIWAATFLLKQYTEAALPVLKELSTREDLIGFDAQIVLQEWEKGTFGP